MRGTDGRRPRRSKVTASSGLTRLRRPSTYAAKVVNGIRVWGKPTRVNKASADKQKSVDIGADLFINNLDLQVDGILRQPNISRDEKTKCPKDTASIASTLLRPVMLRVLDGLRELGGYDGSHHHLQEVTRRKSKTTTTDAIAIKKELNSEFNET